MRIIRRRSFGFINCGSYLEFSKIQGALKRLRYVCIYLFLNPRLLGPFVLTLRVMYPSYMLALILYV